MVKQSKNVGNPETKTKMDSFFFKYLADTVVGHENRYGSGCQTLPTGAFSSEHRMTPN
jgi:hypothetical protein